MTTDWYHKVYKEKQKPEIVSKIQITKYMNDTGKSIKILKNKIFKNKKGHLIKYISKKDKFFKKFGEVYFNEIKLNSTKGWILHKKNTCLIICVSGEVKFTFIDSKLNEKK